MSPIPKNERLPEHSLERFKDLQAYNQTLRRTMDRADEIIRMKGKGLADAERKQLKLELPTLVRDLRLLLREQLNQSGLVATMDLADGSYDNAEVDLALGEQLKQVRNLNADVNHLIGTRTVKKIYGAMNEDLPTWYGVKWRQAKDALKHLLKTAGMVGGLTATGLLGGYGLAYGGVIPGGTVLSDHLKTVGRYLAMGTMTTAAKLAKLRQGSV